MPDYEFTSLTVEERQDMLNEQVHQFEASMFAQALNVQRLKSIPPAERPENWQTKLDAERRALASLRRHIATTREFGTAVSDTL